MIGCVVGLLVAQDDLVPGAPTEERSPRPVPGLLAAAAAVHSVAFGTAPDRAVVDVGSRHPSIASVPGLTHLFRDDWSADDEEFVPWPLPVAWLCPLDYERRIRDMFAAANPARSARTDATLAVARAIRALVDGRGVEAAREASEPFLSAPEDDEAVRAMSRGIEAGLEGETLAQALSPFASGRGGPCRGAAAFVAGAVASARHPTAPGWAFLSSNDLAEDEVLGAIDVFETLLADPSRVPPRRPPEEAEDGDAPDAEPTTAPLPRQKFVDRLLSLARFGNRVARETGA